MRTFKIYSPTFTYSIVNYSHHAFCYIIRTYLSYNWKFVPFDHLHPMPPTPHSPASGNHKSHLCFYEHIIIFYNVYHLVNVLIEWAKFCYRYPPDNAQEVTQDVQNYILKNISSILTYDSRNTVALENRYTNCVHDCQTERILTFYFIVVDNVSNTL